MIDRHRSGSIDASELSCASGEAVLGDSASTLSLSDLQPQLSPARCNVRNPRGHKRVRQYNMSSNAGSSQSLSLSTTSFGSLRSPTGRFQSTADGKSPRRFLRSTTPKTRKRIIDSMKKALSERSLNDSIKIGKEDRIGSEKLKHINEHRLGIAEMRPKERKIKFQSATKTITPTRIHGLRVDDLSIRLMRVCIDEAEKSEAEKLEEEVKRLEAGIKKCFTKIDLTKKETNKDIELAAKIRAENEQLRSEIASIPPPHKQSVKQAQRQLESTVRALKHKIHSIDNQIILLNKQNQLVEAETHKLVGLSNVKEAAPAARFQRKRTILPA